MKRLATLVLAGALAACSSSPPACQVCPALGNTCVPPGACTPATCLRPIVRSALPAEQIQYLGTHKVGTTLSFTVPPDAGSITIVQQANVAGLTVVFGNQVIDNSAVPLTIMLPDGGIAYDDTVDAGSPSPDGGEDPSGHYAYFGGGTPNTAAFTIPNTAASLDAGVPEGPWKLVVNDYAYECTFLSGCNDGGTAENTYDVSVVTRQAPGATMDVAFYIVTDAFTETNAATDSSVQRMVSTFKAIYAQVGIAVNAVFHDVGATDKARFGTNISATSTSPCDDLSQMFTLSGQHPGNTMNLFLVQSLRDASGSGGGTIVGIDGTIPGPASYNGTVQSGAVVSAADLFSGTCGATSPDLGGCGADRVAMIAAHETGHFLGLFHTTEQEGADFDPLMDTPKCPCLSCSSAADRPKCGTTGSNAPQLFSHLCRPQTAPTCGGGDNLMFWFLETGVSAGTISPQQAQVMRLNPLVH